MHCLDHRSVFHMETNVLWAKSYFPPLPPCNVVRKERLADESSNIASRGEGGSERILQQFGKKALCPTHFGQDCRSRVLGFMSRNHNWSTKLVAK